MVTRDCCVAAGVGGVCANVACAMPATRKPIPAARRPCRDLRPSPLWGGDGDGDGDRDGDGDGDRDWGDAIAALALAHDPPPSLTLPQPAAGLPASGKFETDQTLASRGLVGGGNTPSVRRGIRAHITTRSIIDGD